MLSKVVQLRFDLLNLIFLIRSLVLHHLHLLPLEEVQVLLQRDMDMHMARQRLLHLNVPIQLQKLLVLLRDTSFNRHHVLIEQSQETHLGQYVPERNEQLELLRGQDFVVLVQDVVHMHLGPLMVDFLGV